jgi:hypothetical protein
MPIQFYLIGNLSSGYTMASVVDANMRIEPLNIDFQKLLADIKKWYPESNLLHRHINLNLIP